MGSAPSEPSGRYRSLVLVGFMAAGKTAVGRHLEQLTGWRVVDVDAEIEKGAGETVAELFRSRGESWFRREEDRVVREALDLRGVVLVPGGGWAAAPGRVEALANDVLTVWLVVSAEEAVARASREGETRPLLAGAEPALDKARVLLNAREPFYRRAAVHLDTEGRTPLEVAELISEFLRR